MAYRDRFNSYSDNPKKSIYVRLVGIVLSLLSVGWCFFDLLDLLDDSEVIAAEAFRDEAKDHFSATVLAVGAEYLGTCMPAQGVCNASAEVQAACRDAEEELIPKPVAPPRNLHFQPHYATPSACQNRYAPWLLVSWAEQGQNVTRCAYEFGSWAGSIRTDSRIKESVQQLAAEHPTTSTLQVWTQQSQRRCIVGYGSLDDEVEYMRTHVTWTFLVVKLVLAVVYALPCSWWYFTESQDDFRGASVCALEMMPHDEDSHCSE